MEKYSDTLLFLKGHGVECVELHDEDNLAKVLLVPAWQGRVMTSTASGDEGADFGWINRQLISEGKVNPQFNPYGGEERFWLGPEGGPFSLYFRGGDAQVYENWQVPAAIDTEPFGVVERNDAHALFEAEMELKNCAGNCFNIGVKREVTLLSRNEIESTFGVSLPMTLSAVAYRSCNIIENRAENTWTKESGAPSIWMLGMFTPTPSTVVFLPYDTSKGEPKVNSEYFGTIPAERLVVSSGLVCLKIDGEFRSKIGLPKGYDTGICGSYDRDSKTLTLVKYQCSEDSDSYVESKWGEQDNPFGGDVINAYNDGPTETGEVMGPFYEIETSSPAAFLKPGERLAHIQEVVHLQGEETLLGGILDSLVGDGCMKSILNAF